MLILAPLKHTHGFISAIGTVRFRTSASAPCHSLDCQRRKPRPHRSIGLMQPLHYPSRPFDRIEIDLYGPLPYTTAGNRWVIVAVNHMTYAKIAAFPTAVMPHVASFILRHFILRSGAPRKLLNDLGCVFLSEVVESLLRH